MNALEQGIHLRSRMLLYSASGRSHRSSDGKRTVFNGMPMSYKDAQSARVASIEALLGLAMIFLGGCSMVTSTTKELPQLLLADEVIDLRERDKNTIHSSSSSPRLLILALDGVGRDRLYKLLHSGELPVFEKLLGGRSNGEYAHAYFHEQLLATLPSSTGAGWTTAMTGVAPAEHGVVGNEYFIRDQRIFAAPVPISVNTAAPVIRSYTEGYWNNLVQVPGVYEQMRARDPDIRIWISMHQYQAGADKLILSEGAVLSNAFHAFLAAGAAEIGEYAGGDDTTALFREIDQEAIEGTIEQLEARNSKPDVLTIYIPGTDHVAHIDRDGPARAHRKYLTTHLDPLFAQLYKAMEKSGFLDNCYVVLTSDHGQIEVRNDDRHSLGMAGDDEPAALLRKAGYRPRPFEFNVSDEHDFNTVLAYQGALAYLYVADRSACREPGEICDWTRPPRYREDVLPLARAIWLNNRTGDLVPELKGTLDMVLTRKPRPAAEDDLPFEVYVGDRRTVPLADYLAVHPHPDYVKFEARLNDLAVGKYGERAGDILLIAKNSSSYPEDERYYFGPAYYSWHGSPSRESSEIPLVVAHPDYDTETIRKKLTPVLSGSGGTAQQRLTGVLLELRFSSTDAGTE